MSLDVLHLRRPKIDYVSPPICEVLFTGTGTTTIVLEPFTRSRITGAVIEDDGSGNLTLRWPAFPALCYNIYEQQEDGSYILIAECVPCCSYPLPPNVGPIRITPITPDDGEGDLSDPIVPPQPPEPCEDFIDDTGISGTVSFQHVGQQNGMVVSHKNIPGPIQRPWKYINRVSSDLRSARSSGVIQASQAGDIVTASTNFFVASDLNKFLQFDSGGAARQVVMFISPTQVQVGVVEVVALSTFTVYGQTLGGTNGVATNCNGAGQIAGYEEDPSAASFLFWYNDSTGEIRSISGDPTVGPTDINELGFLLYTIIDGVEHRTFIYNPNTSTTTEVTGGTGPFGFALSDNLIVTGQYLDAGDVEAFRWVSSVFTNIHPADAGSNNSDGKFVNNSGLVIGTYFQDVTVRSRTFYNTGGASQSIGFLTAGTSPSTGWVVPEDLNEAGVLVGGADVDSSAMFGTSAGFKWTLADGIVRLFPLPGHTTCYARAINEAGWIVGESHNGIDPNNTACFWRPGSLVAENLNSFLPMGSGWELHEVRGITDDNEFIGSGFLNSESRTFFMKVCALQA